MLIEILKAMLVSVSVLVFWISLAYISVRWEMRKEEKQEKQEENDV